MRLVSTLMKSLFLLLQIAVVLCVKPTLAQGGPVGGPGGGTSGNSYPCLSNVTIENGYRCANNQGVAYNYPQVYKTHRDESNNSIVDYQDPMAAKVGTTLNVILNVTRATGAPNNYSGTLVITAQYFTHAGMVSIPCSNITPISNLMPGHSANVTFSLGALPSYVTKGSLFIYFNGDGHVDGMYEEKLYLLNNQPINCMAIPWVDVLEDSCTWAQGQSTPGGVISALTVGLFQSGAIYYDSSSTISNGPANGIKNLFQLEFFLSRARPLLGQCYDASNYNAICLYSQGRIGYAYLKVTSDPSSISFLANPGVLIGHLDVSTQLYWSNHQLVRLGTIGAISNRHPSRTDALFVATK